MDNSPSRTGIDTLAWLVEEAFDGDPSHSLLANLRDLREEDWIATHGESGRSIAEISEINHLRALLQETDRWPYE